MIVVSSFQVLCAQKKRVDSKSGSAFEKEVRAIIKGNIVQLEQSNTILLRGERIIGNGIISGIYRETGHNRLWTEPKNRRDLIQIIENSYYEGLNPNDYHIEIIRKYDQFQSVGGRLNPKFTAEADIIMTNAMLTFAFHMIQGKVHPTQLDPKWNYSYRSFPDSAEFRVLHRLKTQSLWEGVKNITPQIAQYERLKYWFAYYDSLDKTGGNAEQIKYPGRPLRKGDSSKVVGELKRHLVNYEYSFSSTNSDLFDDELESTLKDFQLRNGIEDDGIAGKRTFDALNISIRERMDILRVNMERFRWINNDLPDEFLLVNVADFHLYLLRKNVVDYKCRVVVGKQHHETPVFNSEIHYVVFNPTWTVPYSIATKEMLPRLKKDSNYLQNRNMTLLRGGKELDPSTVDFTQYSIGNFPFTIRQEQGPQNALGRMKFIFPNQYSVYLHDTPSKSYFEKAERTFSHGCIRVQNPHLLAEQLLGNKGYDQNKISQALDSKEITTVYLKKPLPVYLMYWTCYESRIDKKMYFFKDVYGRDQKILMKLKQER